jgi:phosphatidylinositol alpha-1,6-mannosyltransferase
MTDALKPIRFITRKWPPAVGGMETYSIRLTEELRKRSPVEIIALPGRESGRPPTALALIGFGLRTSMRLLAAPEARIVHVADLASWPFAWIAKVRHPRSLTVLSAHGSDLSFADRPGWRSKLYRAYVRTGAAALKHACVIANSNYIAELARKTGFERVSIVPLATDFGCKAGGERRHLLYAGRITREKGLRFLVEQVLPRLPSDVRLRVAGAVWEKSERSVLDHPQVDYLGVLSPQQLANEFGDAAVVLIPTRTYEGFGLVAIEAAACGAWVIASNHSGLTDVVQPPIGIAVDPNNAGEWVDAIKSALSISAKERAARSQAARAKVDRSYRWSRVAEATLAIYEEDRPA